MHGKFNLQLYYPPQYYREVWHYNDTNTELISRAADQFNWQKNISEQKRKRKSDYF